MVEQAQNPFSIDVLVVDDDRSIKELLGVVVDEMGLSSALYEDSVQALVDLREKVVKPSVAIVDLMMPTVSGEEIVGCLRKYHPNTSVVIISANIDGFDQTTVDAVIPKPFQSLEELENTINRLRDRRNTSSFSPHPTPYT